MDKNQPDDNVYDAASSEAAINFAALRSCRHARLHVPIYSIALGALLLVWLTQSPYLLGTILWLCVVLGWLPVLLGTLPRRRGKDVPTLRKEKPGLPSITILLPVFNETNMAAQLAKAMARLDYPPERLDCMVLLEAHDRETPIAAIQTDWPDFCRLVSVPAGLPHTKARARNYALHRARGDILVIFDAEDQPHPMQLREVARRFNRAPDNLACLQAPLEIIPQETSWMQNQFALEYRLLFKFILPCLGRGSGALPLGGSSNYFRIKALRAIGGWDAYNLTEDADIGMRLAQYGYRIDTVVLPTYENAPHEPLIWHYQRSRWLSGHIQTLYVHMQDFSAFRHHMRLALSCALILLGRLVAAPAHACFIATALHYFGTGEVDAAFDYWLVVSGLVYGSFTWLLYRLSRAPTRRARLWLALTHWLYWLCMLPALLHAAQRMTRGQLDWLKSAHKPYTNSRPDGR